jgi:HK97 family phage major capsid protein
MAAPRTQEQILESIDANLSTVMEGNKDVAKRVQELRAEYEPAVATLKAEMEAMGKTIVTQKEYTEKVEAQLNKERFNTGGGSRFGEPDALLNALPDRVKRVAAYCRNMGVPESPEPATVELPRDARGYSPGSLSLYDDDYRKRRVMGSLARFRQLDPVRYAATISWLFGIVKMKICAFASDTKGAEHWRTETDKLTQAMGGCPVRNAQGEFVMFPDAEQRTALNETTGAEGAFLVPTLIYNVIGWLAKDAEVVRSMGATIITMVGDKLELPRKTVAGQPAGIAYPNEAAAFTDGYTAGPFSIATLNAQKQGAIQPLSMEVLADEITAMGLLDFILADFTNDMGARLDFQAFEGTGSPFTGLLNAAGVTAVTKVTPATITPNDFIRMLYALKERSTIDMGVVTCNPLILRDLLLSNFGTNNPAFIWSTSLSSDGFTPTLIGGKRIFTSSQHSLNLGGATNEGYAYHGDPSELFIGDRLGTTFVVNPWARTEFTQGQVLCRIMRRVAFTVRMATKWARLEDSVVVA